MNDDQIYDEMMAALAKWRQSDHFKDTANRRKYGEECLKEAFFAGFSFATDMFKQRGMWSSPFAAHDAHINRVINEAQK